jgi:Uma2 family endonuclease
MDERKDCAVQARQLADSMPMSEADYLAFEDISDEKHEFRDGRLYAMSGGTIRHSVITMSIGGTFINKLAGKGCSVGSPDTRIYIADYNAYRYADVTVFCGPPAYVPGREDIITNPVILVEVLSPSSAVRDRNDKLDEYTHIDTLQAYLLVDQEQYRVERFSRQSDEWLYQSVTGLDSEISIPSMGITLALADIYRGVQWD